MTHWTCSACGPHVSADEDGCCVTCGADATEAPCDGHLCRILTPTEALDFILARLQAGGTGQFRAHGWPEAIAALRRLRATLPLPVRPLFGEEEGQ